jgi:SAM-dependent methyltransferase
MTLPKSPNGPRLGAQERFAFADNWRRFNSNVSDDQRELARNSLTDWLGALNGLTFLDVGAGSGLFASAALELGAHVSAFDFDPAGDRVERGDVLDNDYMQALGQFDVVYSWGVLHHTGRMWYALENTCNAVRPGGRLFISIYNDQGWRSNLWRAVKRGYGRVPVALRPIYTALMISPLEARAVVRSLLRRENYLATWSTSLDRGMGKWRDIVDWVGGYPFEVAKPEDVFDFCRARGFELERIKTQGGSLGCNEFLFRRLDPP